MSSPVRRRRWRDTWRRFAANRLAVLSCGLLVVLGVLVSLGPILGGQLIGWTPEAIDVGYAYAAPSTRHLLGTDELGRDVLARLLQGGALTLSLALAVGLLSVSLGLAVGAIGGYAGGAIDSVLMRITDTLLAVPAIFILIAVASFTGTSSFSAVAIVLVISLTSWMGPARVVRGEILSIRNREYVVAAQSVGVQSRTIITRHILPNVVPTLIVAATLGVGQAVLIESALSFLGLGVQPPTASWGGMLTNAQNYMWTDARLAVLPGACIMATVLAVNFVGDGLRVALDPRLAER